MIFAMRFSKFILFLGLCLGLSGYLQNYTGMYNIHRVNPALDTTTFRKDLEDVLKPFGFYYVRIWPDKSDYRFIRKVEKTYPDLMALEGANANISLAVWDFQAGITIRDFDNYDETKFIKELKESIEDVLHKKYSLNIECTRQRVAVFNN